MLQEAGCLTFIVGKIFWMPAEPSNLLILLLTIGAFWLVLSRSRRGLGLVVTAAVGLLATAILPIGEWLMLPLENRFSMPAALPAHVDGIIVLGGAVNEIVSQARGRVSVNAAGQRLLEASELAHRYPQARIAVVGGTGHLPASGLPEASVMAEFLTAHGVDPRRMLLESRSRNTYENAVFAYEEVKPKAGETWILVTSAVHMPRAVGCFRGARWPVTPYPADYRTTGRLSVWSNWSTSEELTLVNAAAKEWIGLAAYYLMGRTDALFPAPEPADPG
jgi:uncharacterized SAM-binding protein YcdF (DUF218 family)